MSAFEGNNNIRTVIIPNIARYTYFSNLKSLVSATFKNGIEVIYSGFEGSINLRNVMLPNDIKHIDNETFKGCLNLKSITLPNSVTNISPEAFKGSGITSITIPGNVKTIESDNVYVVQDETGMGAFENCIDLKSITFKSAIPPAFGEFVFDGCVNLETIYVAGFKSRYQRVLSNYEFDIICIKCEIESELDDCECICTVCNDTDGCICVYCEGGCGNLEDNCKRCKCGNCPWQCVHCKQCGEVKKIVNAVMVAKKRIVYVNSAMLMVRTESTSRMHLKYSSISLK